jgi:hypothetical protein
MKTSFKLFHVGAIAMALGCWSVAESALSQVFWFPEPPVLPSTASTPGTEIRNVLRAVQQQVTLAHDSARDLAREARGIQQRESLLQDFQNLQQQFQGLRTQFDWLATLLQQVQRPIDTAELSTGLNTIAQLVGAMQAQLGTNRADLNSLARSCRILEQALDAWDNELIKQTSRLSLELT